MIREGDPANETVIRRDVPLTALPCPPLAEAVVDSQNHVRLQHVTENREQQHALFPRRPSP